MNCCAICLSEIKKNELYLTECFHSFCITCFQEWKQRCSKLTCPMCRYNLEKEIKKFDFEMIDEMTDSDIDSEDENAVTDYEIDETSEEDFLSFEGYSYNVGYHDEEYRRRTLEYY